MYFTYQCLMNGGYGTDLTGAILGGELHTNPRLTRRMFEEQILRNTQHYRHTNTLSLSLLTAGDDGDTTTEVISFSLQYKKLNNNL